MDAILNFLENIKVWIAMAAGLVLSILAFDRVKNTVKINSGRISRLETGFSNHMQSSEPHPICKWEEDRHKEQLSRVDRMESNLTQKLTSIEEYLRNGKI